MRTTGGSSVNASSQHPSNPDPSRSASGTVAGERRRLAVLTDFDDTAAEQNVAELLLTRFGDPSWQDVRARFRAGGLTLKDYQEIAFRTVTADRKSMQRYVKQQANLRPHFAEMLAYCREHDIPVAVVSHGLDFYIRALLEAEGVAEVPVYSVNTAFEEDGIKFFYPFPYPGEEHRGNSKGLIVDRYHGQGRYVIYAGDGRSDLEPAERADMVFAHSVLAQECGKRSIAFHPFNDFGDVLAALRELGRQPPEAVH